MCTCLCWFSPVSFSITTSLFFFFPSLIRARNPSPVRRERASKVDEARFLRAKDPRSVVLWVLAPDAMSRSSRPSVSRTDLPVMNVRSIRTGCGRECV